jgi:hypothetical protein
MRPAKEATRTARPSYHPAQRGAHYIDHTQQIDVHHLAEHLVPDAVSPLAPRTEADDRDNLAKPRLFRYKFLHLGAIVAIVTSASISRSSSAKLVQGDRSQSASRAPSPARILEKCIELMHLLRACVEAAEETDKKSD